MTISVGSTLPEATFLRIGPDGPESISLSARLKGRKVVIFGVPGAFTRTCSNAHVPSFMRTRDGFAAKGVAEVICVSVNDPFVMTAWGDSIGASAAGITMLADADGSFTRSIGLGLDIPAIGLFGRSRRYALLAEDGIVTVLNLETARGECEISGGEALLAQV